ncbi:MAG: steroid 5-alpha reductase family enzyme [Verrucomicrobiales bacterium]|jgi:steroid 5-alpha reductase family enzyme
MNSPTILAIAAGVLLVIFLFTWWLARRIDNYSIVDVTWSLSFAPIAILHALLGNGWMPRRVAIGCLVAIWSLRLGSYLWSRVAAHHPQVDPRYAILSKRWEKNPARSYLIFFLAQGLLVWLLMLPVHFVAGNAAVSFHPLEIAGFTLWMLGLVGEAIADAQLKRFKKESTDRLAVCKRGLWRYSRHPNYFFQSLLWWGLFLMAVSMPWGWVTIIAPLAMLHFLLRVTGVPLTEELAIEKRGDVYRDYQNTTSAFIPLPPKTTPQPDNV